MDIQEQIKIIQNCDFKHIIDEKSQSWSGFTGSLFSKCDARERKEFDQVNFYFSSQNHTITKNDWIDDLSINAAYFGRPIDVTDYLLPLENTLSDQLKIISDLVPLFYESLPIKKTSACLPILVIASIESNIGRQVDFISEEDLDLISEEESLDSTQIIDKPISLDYAIRCFYLWQ